MKIALAQINTTIGDLDGNAAKIKKYIEKAQNNKCDLVIFPELALTGYPPKDLLLNKDFIDKTQKTLNSLISCTKDIGVLIGSIITMPSSDKLYNAMILIDNMAVKAKVIKNTLSAYADYDEDKYFDKGEYPADNIINFKDKKLSIVMGNDFRLYTNTQKDNSADIVIIIEAYPYYYGKYEYISAKICKKAIDMGKPIIYLNGVGGNDTVVFEGGSMIFDGNGKPIKHAKLFEEDFVIYEMGIGIQPSSEIKKEDISCLYRALVLGLRDYCSKCGFNSIVLGLSGGIDSSLNACIAADAVGSQNVLGVSMPSRYSSQHSKDDAKALADNLDIKYNIIPIENIFEEYLKIFNEPGDIKEDLAEENIQARIRGNLLMFLSNREGRLLISSENKSEIYVGYSTLYGDMCGGLSVIGDIYKTRVYELCSYINREKDLIPKNVLIKSPSAELRSNQKDEDSLPPYSILDKILYMYVDKGCSTEEIIAQGFDKATVYSILNMVDRTEYKRKQAPPFINITKTAFKAKRSMPLIHKYKHN